jgi:lysophospholipase L1-like esterase
MISIAKKLGLASGFVIAMTFTFLGTLTAGNLGNYTYLAIGDSIPFGMNPLLLPPPPSFAGPVPSPSAFVGYPETIAAAEHLLTSKKVVNAACPGLTTDSFMKAGVLDLGCYGNGPQGQPPFISWVGIKAAYTGSQMDFAASQLSSNKHINLVTLSIGANDVLLAFSKCAKTGDVQCIGPLTEILGTPPTGQNPQGTPGTYARNLAAILASLRGTGYTGTIVLVGYYSPSVELIPVALALNGAMQAMQQPFGTTFADGLTAFQTAAGGPTADVCAAGLLVQITPGNCDIHPSPKGRDLLAATIMAAVAASH